MPSSIFKILYSSLYNQYYLVTTKHRNTQCVTNVKKQNSLKKTHTQTPQKGKILPPTADSQMNTLLQTRCLSGSHYVTDGVVIKGLGSSVLRHTATGDRVLHWQVFSCSTFKDHPKFSGSHCFYGDIMLSIILLLL